MVAEQVLQGRVAIVTGGASGIGRATAQRFSAAGAAVVIARLATEAGFPDGMLNVVTGLGHEAGAALTAHPDVDHISFTGSRPVGTAVATAAAANVVPVVLELGGKSPDVVFADADLGQAIPLIVNSIVQNAGQTCSAGSRVLVHRAVHGEVIARIRERFEAVGMGREPDDPDLGPLINAKQRDRVAGMVERGRGDAELVTDGTAPGAGSRACSATRRPRPS